MEMKSQNVKSSLIVTKGRECDDERPYDGVTVIGSGQFIADRNGTIFPLIQCVIQIIVKYSNAYTFITFCPLSGNKLSSSEKNLQIVMIRCLKLRMDLN